MEPQNEEKKKNTFESLGLTLQGAFLVRETTTQSLGGKRIGC